MSHPFLSEPLPMPRADAPKLLTWGDLEVVLALLAESAPGWSAELNHATADDSTIVITPEGANDLIGPAFILHRTRTGVELDQFRWDEYRKIGEFLFLNGALTALRARLVPLVSRQIDDVRRGSR